MTAPRSAREHFPALARQAAVYEDTLATLNGEYDQLHVQASNALNMIDGLVRGFMPVLTTAEMTATVEASLLQYPSGADVSVQDVARTIVTALNDEAARSWPT